MKISGYFCVSFVLVLCYVASGQASGSSFDPKCTLCKSAVKQVEDMIDFGHHEEDIIGNLTQGCHDISDALPEAIRPIFLDLCVEFVDVTIRDIIDQLQQELEPENICTTIGLCNSDESMILETYLEGMLKEAKAAKLNKQDISGPGECRLCKKTVTTIEEKIGLGPIDGHIEKQIIEQLTKSCMDTFADNPVFEDTCEALVNSFVKDVLDLFREGLEPEHICEILGVCPGPEPTTTAQPTTEEDRTTTGFPPIRTTTDEGTTRFPPIRTTTDDRTSRFPPIRTTTDERTTTGFPPIRTTTDDRTSRFPPIRTTT